MTIAERSIIMLHLAKVFHWVLVRRVFVWLAEVETGGKTGEGAVKTVQWWAVQRYSIQYLVYS
jgi:hypothetical protein